jgi:WD40 repeat protein
VAEADGGGADNHSGVVRAVAMHGDLLVTGGVDAAVKLWDWTHDGGLRYCRTLTGHTDRVEGVTVDQHTGACVWELLRWRWAR